MPWLGIWFEHEAHESGARNPDMFKGLVQPVVYPYARGFVEAEAQRLLKSRDPGSIVRGRERFDVYYSLNHDGGQTGLDQQGCRILNWLFLNFDPGGRNKISPRFSEIPVVIHAVDPVRAAAMGNALAILRFLGAAEDQAIAKILLHPWNPLRGSPALSAAEYEKRVMDFLHGDLFYPPDVTLFDILERRDLKSHRTLETCCLHQIGFITSILAWIDECWPESDEERRALQSQLRNSLADEVTYWKKPAPPPSRNENNLPDSFR